MTESALAIGEMARKREAAVDLLRSLLRRKGLRTPLSAVIDLGSAYWVEVGEQQIAKVVAMIDANTDPRLK